MVQSSAPDPALIGAAVARSWRVARGRHRRQRRVVVGRLALRDALVPGGGLPRPRVVDHRRPSSRSAVAVVIGAWIARNPDVVAAISTPEDLKQLVDQDFADYYTSNPAGLVRVPGVDQQRVGRGARARRRCAAVPARHLHPVDRTPSTSGSSAVSWPRPAGSTCSSASSRRTACSSSPRCSSRAAPGSGWAGRSSRPGRVRARSPSRRRVARRSRSPSVSSSCCWSAASWRRS